jgi:hypothetical protein
MTHHITTATDLTTPRRRRRAPRPLAPLVCVPDDRTSDALDDEHAAQELLDDLLALVEAGLIVPVQYPDGVRYAPADPDDLAA